MNVKNEVFMLCYDVSANFGIYENFCDKCNILEKFHVKNIDKDTRNVVQASNVDNSPPVILLRYYLFLTDNGKGTRKHGI